MQITDLDCSVFSFDPTNDYDMRKLEQSHKDFQLPLGKDIEPYRRRILKYIILYYDINSPLRIMFANDLTRKVEAYIMAFKVKNREKQLPEFIEDILTGQSWTVNTMIIRFVMMFYNDRYLRLVVFREMLGQISRKKIERNTEIKGADITTINDLSANIEHLQRTIFGGNESTQLKEELYKVIEKEHFNLHPDLVAKELAENPDLFEKLGDSFVDDLELED
jgi:hypothetical protein